MTVGDFVPGLSEVLDWCHRARAKGYGLIHVDDLRVSHPTRADWADLLRKWRRLTAEGFGVNGTGPAAKLRWAIRALAMPLSILAHAPRVLIHPRLNGMGERVAAFATLVRLRMRRMGWMLWQAMGGSI